MFRKRRGVAVVGALVLFVALGMFFLWRYYFSVPQAEHAQDAVAIVGKLMYLPPSETPTVATVSDPEKLLSQPFFAKAQKGDIVLIYPVAGKAILYRPSVNKIVEVASIALDRPFPTNP